MRPLMPARWYVRVLCPGLWDVSDLHATLAAILDRGRPGEEGEVLLAAIIAGGVYIPVDGQGSVIFVGVDDSGPVLPGYVSDTCLRQWLPSSADAVLCDALRLIDIAEHTVCTRWRSSRPSNGPRCRSAWWPVRYVTGTCARRVSRSSR